MKRHMRQSIQEWTKQNLWKTAFKIYLVHSWILCPVYWFAKHRGVELCKISHTQELRNIRIDWNYLGNYFEGEPDNGSRIGF